MSKAVSTHDHAVRLGGLALAVGAIGLPFGAQAAVVTYSTAQGFPATIRFDPTTGAIGGTAPVQFNVVGQTSTSNMFQEGQVTGINSNKLISINPNAIGQAAYKYSPGAVIGPSSFTNSSSTAPLNSSGAGLTLKDSPYYIGLEVDLSGALTLSAAGLNISVPVFYGYAEIDNPGGSDQVLNYAFETSANTAITIPSPTGTGTAVPEPCSLALLAAGAVGVAAMRRRRAAA